MGSDNMKQFQITKVIVNNFRGYDGKFDFSFEKEGKIPSLILLTGANGYGKTSLIDAIEWGFTGRISRLIRQLDNRVDSKEKDNIKNNEGLIANTKSKDKSVEVEIEGFYKGKKIKLNRIFKGEVAEREAIIGNSSEFNIICEDEVRSEIEEKLLKFNYDNLCSYDKNIDLYNKGRKDIYEIFSSSYSDENNLSNIIQNLDKVKLHLEKSEKIIENNIEKIDSNLLNYSEIKENYSYNLNDITYPEEKLYSEEKILHQTKNLKIKDIENQRNTLLNIINIKVLEELNEINVNQNKNKLVEVLELKEEVFKQLSNQDFDVISKNIRELKELNQYVKEMNSYMEISSSIKYKDNILEINGNDIINEIKNIEDEISNLNKNISIYSEDSKISELLKYIVDNNDEFIQYQSSHDQCPLCGNDKTFKESKIGEIARQILGENDIERQIINSKIKKLKYIKNSKVDELKQNTDKYINEKLVKLEKKLKDKKYISEIKELLKKLGLDYKENLLAILKSELLASDSENSNNKEKQLVSYIHSKQYGFINDLNLPYEEYENLSLDSKHKFIQSLISRFDININNKEEIIVQNKDEIDNRVSICNSYINRLKKDELTKKMQENEKNKLLKQEELKSIQEKINNIKLLVKNIKVIKTEDENNQTELIRKPLEHIYRKITRNTNIKRIELNRGKAEGKVDLDIVDINDKKTSFANILSAGQLSTLSISIFLAKAYLNSGDSLKLYLMDEPIQTMDDLNILSFIDLMKYQLVKDNKDSFIDQVIFSTCDDNLGRLFKYKFNSFNIPVCEYKFEGKGKFIEL